MRIPTGRSLWLYCVAALALAGLVGCQTTITMTLAVSGSSVYEARADEPGVFVVTATQSEQIIYAEGGPAPQLSRRQDSRVPGVDYQGHSRLQIRKKADEKYVVAFDYLMHDKVEDVWLDAESAYEAEVKFVRGSWADFQEGRSVEMVLTPEGQDIARQEGSRLLSESMSKGLQDKTGKNVTTTVEQFTTEGVDRLAGTRSRLEYTSAPARVSLRIRLSG